MKKRTSQEKSKLLCYFDLWDAFQKPGCAVCILVERQSLRYLDALLYERVNDVGTRERLRASLGFCNWHAWKALDVQHCSLGLGIIYGDILKRVEERLTKVKNFFPVDIPFISKIFRRDEVFLRNPYLRPKQRCPACQHVRFFEKFFLETLLDFISEADFERQFNHSSGVCFSHLTQAAEQYPRHKNMPLIIKKQMQKFESLRNEVAEFIRKQDYQYHEEPRGSERDSWKRALEMVAGKREIFPNQVNREIMGDEQLEDFPPVPPQDQPADKEGQEGLPELVESLKFENEKLRRKYEELREEYTKENSRASSLHYIAWKTSEDNKILKMNLAGANAQAQGYAEHIDRLNREIEKLKELLKKQGRCDNVRDEMNRVENKP